MSRVSVIVCVLVALCAGVVSSENISPSETLSVNHIYEEKLRALCDHEHSMNSCIELFLYQYRLPLMIGGGILAILVLCCLGCCLCCCCRKRYHTVSQA